MCVFVCEHVCVCVCYCDVMCVCARMHVCVRVCVHVNRCPALPTCTATTHRVTMREEGEGGVAFPPLPLLLPSRTQVSGTTGASSPDRLGAQACTCGGQ